jgi:hypothetical protein
VIRVFQPALALSVSLPQYNPLFVVFGSVTMGLCRKFELLNGFSVCPGGESVLNSRLGMHETGRSSLDRHLFLKWLGRP